MSDFYPIANTLAYCSTIDIKTSSQNAVILCDFDGTISLDDVTDIVLENFADKRYEQIEQQWLDGVIGSKECMSQQIALINANKKQMDDLLATVEIDTSFIEFVNVAAANNIALHILSDGLDYTIKSILQRYNLFLPVFANQLLHDDKHGWKIGFPYYQPNCIKASGNCKCHHLFQQQEYVQKVIYVGDGASDYCVSNKADLVFAKKKLITYCQQNNINYKPIDNFNDAIDLLQPFLNKTITNK